jgi:transcriptional regulator with XRE-family HTH domain
MEAKTLFTWAQELKKARTCRGLAVKQAAEIHGVSLGTFWNWENGLHAPQDRYLEPMIAKWPEIRQPSECKLSSLI